MAGWRFRTLSTALKMLAQATVQGFHRNPTPPGIPPWPVMKRTNQQVKLILNLSLTLRPLDLNVENSQDTPAMAHAAAQVRPVSSACVRAAVLIITDATPRARAMPPAQP